jgi:endonuclease III
MASPNKERVLAKLTAVLFKQFPVAAPKDYSVLDHVLLSAVQEGTGFCEAAAAYERLRASFHDFNEMRVSHVNELAELLDGIPDKQAKAKRILQILQFVFETTYSYDLEQMRRKPLKQATKQLSMIHGTNPYIVAGVVQRGLGGHAIGVDSRIAELLREIQFAGPEETLEEIQASLEQLIPKAKGAQFSMALSELACQPPKKLKALLKEIAPSAASRTKTARSAGSKGAEKKSARKK